MSATAEKTGLDLFLGAVDTLDQLAARRTRCFCNCGNTPPAWPRWTWRTM